MFGQMFKDIFNILKEVGGLAKELGHFAFSKQQWNTERTPFVSFDKLKKIKRNSEKKL